MPGPGRTTQPTIPSLRHLLFTVLLLAGFTFPATAVTIDGLYTVEVPVAGSSPGQLQSGYAEGLRQVLLRVSGSSEVLDQENLASLLQNAESMLQSYQFLRADAEHSGNRLRMTFGSVGVNRALSSIDAPVWGANRPLTLAWIAVQDAGGRQLITRGDGEAAASGVRWLQAFQSAAARRGLPLTVPSQTVAGDRELLSEVWGQFMGRIRQESKAVGYDLLSSVRISSDRGSWRASWTLEGRGFDETESSVQGSSPEDLAARIVGRWADLLAARYAVAAGDVGESPQVDIILDQVQSLADYAAAKAALDALTPVVNVGPVRVKSGQSTLRVAFSGELSQLEEYMALDPRFVRVEAAPDPATAKPRPLLPSTYPTRESVTTTTEADQPGVEPEAGGAPMQGGDSGQAEADDLFSYQPIAVDEQGAEQAFESLYPILHYRWQPAPVVPQAGQE